MSVTWYTGSCCARCMLQRVRLTFNWNFRTFSLRFLCIRRRFRFPVSSFCRYALHSLPAHSFMTFELCANLFSHCKRSYSAFLSRRSFFRSSSTMFLIVSSSCLFIPSLRFLLKVQPLTALSVPVSCFPCSLYYVDKIILCPISCDFSVFTCSATLNYSSSHF